MPLDLDTDNSEGHGQSYEEGARDYVWTRLTEQSVALYMVTTDREACSLHLQDLATRIWNTKVSKVSLTDKSSDHPGKSISPSVPKTGSNV